MCQNWVQVRKKYMIQPRSTQGNITYYRRRCLEHLWKKTESDQTQKRHHIWDYVMAIRMKTYYFTILIASTNSCLVSLFKLTCSLLGMHHRKFYRANIKNYNYNKVDHYLAKGCSDLSVGLQLDRSDFLFLEHRLLELPGSSLSLWFLMKWTGSFRLQVWPSAY